MIRRAFSGEYIRVESVWKTQIVEIEAESDGSLLLDNIAAQFPNAKGLSYKTKSNSCHGVRHVDKKLLCT